MLCKQSVEQSVHLFSSFANLNANNYYRAAGINVKRERLHFTFL